MLFSNAIYDKTKVFIALLVVSVINICFMLSYIYAIKTGLLRPAEIVNALMATSVSMSLLLVALSCRLNIRNCNFNGFVSLIGFVCWFLQLVFILASNPFGVLYK